MNARSTRCTRPPGRWPSGAIRCSRPPSRRCVGSACAPGGSARSPPPPSCCSTTATAAPHDQQTGRAVTGNGSLTRWCPASLIDAAIETCDTREQRVRVLSARSVVYCELVRCLFPGEGYEQILDHLLSRDDDIPAWRTDHIPCGSSLCRARVKIGCRTMEAVFHGVAGQIAEPQSCPAAFWHQLRLEAFDGTTFEVADTEEND